MTQDELERNQRLTAKNAEFKSQYHVLLAECAAAYKRGWLNGCRCR